MARRPPEDPEVTDLARYRKAREQARRRAPPRAAQPPGRRQPLLGSNPRAGLILVLAAAALAALWLAPQLAAALR